MLQTKSILEKIGETDGIRISIMSRHTLNDGVTLHPNITSSSYNLWIKSLSPPNKLVGDYYKRNLPWQDFENRYIEHIRQPKLQNEVKALAKLALEETITLLCIEDSPEYCHRRLLAEECRRYESDLILYIR